MTKSTPLRASVPSLSLVSLILALSACPVLASAESTSNSALIERSERYAFHSNFWINLHHFLFRQAQLPDGQPMEGGRLLSRSEFADIDGAIDWYRDNLSRRSLLMDRYLYKIKRKLIEYDNGEFPASDAISDDHRAQLKAAADVYRRYYWPRHDRQNREIVSWHLSKIRSHESKILTRISELAQESWPDETIRVDLTWDANWAGAYCTVKPTHVVLTSRPGGPQNRWPPGGWFELLFHEASHALIDPNSSTVGRTIASLADELEVSNADQLWHAVLFLFSGTAVKEALRSQGVEHELIMISEGIFVRYQPAVLDGFAPYIAGNASLRAASTETLSKL